MFEHTTEIDQLSTFIFHLNREMYEILSKWEVPTVAILELLNGENTRVKNDIELYLFLETMIENLKKDTQALTNANFGVNSFAS